MNWKIFVGFALLIASLYNLADRLVFGLLLFSAGLALAFWGFYQRGKNEQDAKEDAFRREFNQLPSTPSMQQRQDPPPQPSANRTLIKEDYTAAGVIYYESNINKLATRNPGWKLTAKAAASQGKCDTMIFRYNYINKPVKLIPEPENEHDKNAVKIVIAGELVGYISRADNVHVLDILNHHKVKYISGFIGGGDYKVISKDGAIDKGKKGHNVSIRIAYV